MYHYINKALMIFEQKTRQRLWPILLTALICLSCEKFLDHKPVPDIVTPTKLSDLKALLDDNQTMNYAVSPSLIEVYSDDYYTTLNNWLTLDPVGNYFWGKDAFDESSWTMPYTKSIFRSNIVLDVLPNVTDGQQLPELHNYIKGTALFHRSFVFLELAQVFCKPYTTESINDLGIVLRTTSAIEAPSTRATVGETYERIISDFLSALDLLPSHADFSYQPTKKAVYGALARTYLYMREYDSALKYADMALEHNAELLDYNILVAASNTPFFGIDNPEVIFFHTAFGHGITGSAAVIDTNLLNSYEVNDIRSKAFFRLRNDVMTFKGSYAGTAGSAGAVFTGITTGEMYLTRAECRARAGDVAGAIEDLNYLLRHRYLTGTYTDVSVTNAEDAKNRVLTERRKELLFRGRRWPDLRRFNLEGANITLTRILDGVTYTLPPNDLRWTALIPPDEIVRSGLQQNPR